MGPRVVAVTLEIETDLSLSQLGQRLRWRHDDVARNGRSWQVRQVEANVIRPTRKARRSR